MAECFANGDGKKEARYGWSKAPYNLIYASSESTLSKRAGETIYYSDSYIFNEVTQTIDLINPTGIVLSSNVGLDLRGRYVAEKTTNNLIGGAVGRISTIITSWEFNGAWYGLDLQKFMVDLKPIEGCVIDGRVDAYPADGYYAGHKYIRVVN